jgi:hypothetical protein
MAVLQPDTANQTPHPAPVAPLADQRWPREVNGGLVLCSEMENVLSLGEVAKSSCPSQAVLSDRAMPILT